MYLEPEVIYEDEDIVVLSKPAGVLMHSDDRNQEETIADYLRVQYPEVAGVGDKPEQRPGIVHRLDKDTSGVVVVARNQETFLYLKELFKQGKVKKTYKAIVHGTPKEKEGEINATISLKPGTVKRTVHKGKMSKEALTQYKVIDSMGDYSYLEIYPKTGRTHQIRVHLASIGHPIIGDTLYGRKKDESGASRQMLHAWMLELDAKPGKAFKFQADLPEDFAQMLETLKSA